jgi:sulfite reductase (ferredoxin)
MQDLVRSEAAAVWKEKLNSGIRPDWRNHIDEFETDILLKKQGKVDDKLFAETRLRMGAYGQRYDNGHRHNGTEAHQIPFSDEFKGPGTYWDAPGMERIKLPYGGMTPDQMDVMADLAEEYSDGICHITTRQDIQLHYVHIENCPSMFRRLAAAGITVREACGNSVRNVTGCPLAGVCKDEEFDITPYAHAVFEYLLGHPDVQDFGRKMKIALSGCSHNPCGLTNIHDIGYIAKKQVVNGVTKRGFELYVGGGLGAVPYEAKVFGDFVAEEDILGLTQAICRIFARLGEKKKRHRARIKFLVADLGIEKFRELVLEERAKLPDDPRWRAYLANLDNFIEKPLKSAGSEVPKRNDADYTLWCKTNLYAQRQSGYSTVTVALPLGDMSSNQMRALAEVCRQFVKDTVRTTVEQNIVLRWVSNNDIPALYDALKTIGLAQAGAESIVDVTACPGTDTCKLGISSSRGLAGELRNRLAKRFHDMDSAAQGLRVKVSGCFNSCGQQHIADIGFYGISRNVGGYVVPHFQMVLGGEWTNNGGTYGIGVGGVPSKAVPAVVDRLTELYVKGRQGNEGFRQWVERTGKGKIMESVQDLTVVPAYERDKSFYVDWGDVREYSVKDKGIGECAGELVTLADFGLKAADRELFEAQIKYDEGDIESARVKAYQAMLFAAQGLVKNINPDVSNDPNAVMAEFVKHFHDTAVFNDPFAGARFQQYYFHAHDERGKKLDREQTARLLHEGQLFIEAAHSCHLRQMTAAASAPKNPIAGAKA